jgi:hypothetical protein
MAQVVKPPKPPSEKRWLTINFDEKAKDALAPGDALSTILSFLCRTSPQGEDVTAEMVESGSPAILANDLKLTFMTGEGIDKQDYEYEAIVDTLLGETLTEYLILEVRGRNVEPTS